MLFILFFYENYFLETLLDINDYFFKEFNIFTNE